LNRRERFSKGLVLVDEIPRSPSGKIERHRLRESAARLAD